MTKEEFYDKWGYRPWKAAGLSDGIIEAEAPKFMSDLDNVITAAIVHRIVSGVRRAEQNIQREAARVVDYLNSLDKEKEGEENNGNKM